MMKLFSRISAAFALTLSLAGFGSQQAQAIGWPANYQGVMLQGFYWDSYTDTKWTNLEAQADELSQYFKLIWVPNSAKSTGGMGYMPIYWFTNHNSDFGTEAQLRSMIKTYKAKGTGIIADCVINHRAGKSNWTDFPAETWNGTTWQIGPEGICSTDEVRNASGQAKPTGAPDTGDDFDGARDLDHTNANVQNNCKNYVKCLQEDFGYAGMRYDMVKGYGGQYTKIYNQYANVQYSVGEYWDGQYDAVKAWIEATGRTSAAFDFPCKYAINEAFASNDMTKLCWLANGSNPQPAGMIHFGYQQYSVTFVDNHDTYRDGSKFTGNVPAANAFILFSPGTPCVFLPHYKQYKAEIQKMINVRNACGIHNMSAVKVLRHDASCYMAEITGTKGRAVVKIGSAMASPSGYSDSQIKVSGNNYCVWATEGGDTPVVGGDDPVVTPGTTPSKLYIIGNLQGSNWSTSASPAMTKNGDKFTYKATFTAAAEETFCFFNFSDALGADWDILNASANRYGAAAEGTEISNPGSATLVAYLNNVDASACKSFKVKPGTYDVTVDFSTMKVSLGSTGGGDDPVIGGGDDDGDVYLYVDGWDNVYAYVYNEDVTPKIENAVWPGVAMTKDAATGYWKYKIPDNLKSYCRVIINTNGGPDRYPADFEPGMEMTGKSMIFHTSGNGWVSGVDDLYIDADAPTEYYNLQGVRVANPTAGIYIVRRGSKISKVVIQ